MHVMTSTLVAASPLLLSFCCPSLAQACSGYPESGVCDGATWRFLLGDDASPSEILNLYTGDSADEDLSEQVRGQPVSLLMCSFVWHWLQYQCSSLSLALLLVQNTDRVWLLGEQRWEDRSRVKRSS
jgi:hypothetical protein